MPGYDLQCLFKLLLWPMGIFIAFPGRPEIRSDQQNSVECLLRIKTEGTDPVLYDSIKGSGALVVQMSNHGKCQPSSFNMLDCHAYNC